MVRKTTPRKSNPKNITLTSYDSKSNSKAKPRTTPKPKNTSIKRNKAAANRMENTVVEMLCKWCEQHDIKYMIYRYPSGLRMDQKIDIMWDGHIYAGVECKLSVETSTTWDGTTLSILVKNIGGNISKENGLRQVVNQEDFLDKSCRIGLYCVATKINPKHRTYSYIFFSHTRLYDEHEKGTVRLNMSGDSIYVWNPHTDNCGFKKFLDNLKRR